MTTQSAVAVTEASAPDVAPPDPPAMARWTEAPASATVTFAHPSGAGVLFTLRADTGRQLLAMVDAAIGAATDAHGWTPTAGSVGRTNGYAPAPMAAPAPAAQSAATAPTPPGVESATPAEIVIVQPPRPDGAVVVEFWRTGRQYAEERVVRQPDRVAGLLADIGLDTAPGRYDVPCTVYWVLGKAKGPRPDGTPGGHYHDVTRIVRAAS